MVKAYLKKFAEYLWIGFLISLVGYCTYSGFKGSEEDKKKWIPTEENIEKWEKKKIALVNNEICNSIRQDLQNAKEKETYKCYGSYKSFITQAKIFIPMSGLLDRIPKNFRSLDHIEIKLDELDCKDNIVEKWKNCPTGYKPEYKNR
jgi:hypothetical protein